MKIDDPKPASSASSSSAVIAAVTTVLVVVMAAILVLLTVCLLRGRKVCFLQNSMINIHTVPLQNKKRDLNKAKSGIPGSNGPVTTTCIHDMKSSDDMKETEGGLDMTRNGSSHSILSTTPLLVSEESKYARVEAVRGPRPPPNVDQRVEYDLRSQGYSGVSLSSPTPLVVSEESKYARVEAVGGPRPPPNVDQRVEYEMIDLKATKVS